MAINPSLLTRLRAAVRNEVTAADLEAYRQAGLAVYETLDQLQQRRREMLIAGNDPWTVDLATQAQLLAGWLAYVLQTLGDDFVAADYAADPGTVGYVPVVTMKQSMLFYGDVGDWLSICREAAVNPAYRLAAQRIVPLPSWVEAEPCPMAHLQAMVSAASKLAVRAEALMSDVVRPKLTAEQTVQLQRVEQLLERGRVYRERAEQLWGFKGGVSERLHEEIEVNVKQAIQTFFDAGQLLAMPALIEGYNVQVPAQSPSTASVALPGTPGFDMWALTDPTTRQMWQRDPAAVRAIEALWQADPDPAKTLRVQAEIDAAERRGDLVRGQLGNYYCCPWSAIYQAVNPVTIGRARVRRGQKFIYDVSGEEMAEGGPFKREILVADFAPTSNVDYCNPDDDG